VTNNIDKPVLIYTSDKHCGLLANLLRSSLHLQTLILSETQNIHELVNYHQGVFFANFKRSRGHNYIFGKVAFVIVIDGCEL